MEPGTVSDSAVLIYTYSLTNSLSHKGLLQIFKAVQIACGIKLQRAQARNNFNTVECSNKYCNNKTL